MVYQAKSPGKLLVKALLLALLSSQAYAQKKVHYEPTLASLNQHPLPQWYADAKLGIFIHWGCTQYRGGLRYRIPNMTSAISTTSRITPMPSGTTT